MSIVFIPRGANRIIRRTLRQADAVTALPVADLQSVTLQVMQRGEILRTLVLGTDPELRAGPTAAAVVLEWTTGLSAAVPRNGSVLLRWILRYPSADFVADDGIAVEQLDEAPFLLLGGTADGVAVPDRALITSLTAVATPGDVRGFNTRFNSRFQKRTP